MKKSELDKLEEYLKNNDWSYTRKDEDWRIVHAGKKAEHSLHQIIVYNKTSGKRFFDAICHKGSYGYDNGLLEVMGEIVKDDYDVEGWLTAAEIIKRLEEKEE